MKYLLLFLSLFFTLATPIHAHNTNVGIRINGMLQKEDTKVKLQIGKKYKFEPDLSNFEVIPGVLSQINYQWSWGEQKSQQRVAYYRFTTPGDYPTLLTLTRKDEEGVLYGSLTVHIEGDIKNLPWITKIGIWLDHKLGRQ